ncbi:MAG: hypothetical protein Kow0031_39260 [Anaerolineae bacterium]
MLKPIKQSNLQTAIQYTSENVATHRFLLSEHGQRFGWANDTSLADFKAQTGLADLFCQALYFKMPGFDQGIEEALQEADGYIFFMHGWTGSHRIWEELPMWLTGKHKNIVSFNFDLNGFGQSPFLQDTPAAASCSPAAIMRSVEYWLKAIKLWPPLPERKRPPFYLFVGHSMSGAALFYKDTAGWRDIPHGFYALAPALFHNSTQQQAFFKTVGVSIGLPSFNTVKDALAPRVIDILGPGASPDVKTEHLRVYNETSFGTLAQTLYMLGAPSPPPHRTDWHRYRVALGHKDRIVRMDSLLSVLESLNFRPEQIRLTLGDHYFFSCGPGSPPAHCHNQEIVRKDLLEMCFALTREARQPKNAGF